jgi:hypothetical protein
MISSIDDSGGISTSPSHDDVSSCNSPLKSGLSGSLSSKNGSSVKAKSRSHSIVQVRPPRVVLLYPRSLLLYFL